MEERKRKIMKLHETMQPRRVRPNPFRNGLRHGFQSQQPVKNAEDGMSSGT